MSQQTDTSSTSLLWRRTERRPVARVIDGDTLELDQYERVRLIGIDCPEMNEPLGPEVADWIRRNVEGRLVRLSFDAATILTNHRDRYGRTLAYVWLSPNELLNRELLRVGYATVECGYPCRLTNQFLGIERLARRYRRGLRKIPHRCVQRALMRESDPQLDPIVVASRRRG